MSLESSSHLPGGFQVRHRTLGIFQGTAAGMAFWHPSSSMPEYGLCRFGTEKEARDYVEFFCSAKCAEPLSVENLTIEPFDEALHAQLISDYPMPSAWDAPP